MIITRERIVGAKLTLIAPCSQPRRFALGPVIGIIQLPVQNSMIRRANSFHMADCWRCSSAVQKPRTAPASY
jgi:hypothetical protein